MFECEIAWKGTEEVPTILSMATLSVDTTNLPAVNEVVLISVQIWDIIIIIKVGIFVHDQV